MLIEKFDVGFETLNNRVQGYGFTGCVAWSYECRRNTLFKDEDIDNIRALKCIRLLYAHGYSRDIMLTKATYAALEHYIKKSEVYTIKATKKDESKHWNKPSSGYKSSGYKSTDYKSSDYKSNDYKPRGYKPGGYGASSSRYKPGNRRGRWNGNNQCGGYDNDHTRY